MRLDRESFTSFSEYCIGKEISWSGLSEFLSKIGIVATLKHQCLYYF